MKDITNDKGFNNYALSKLFRKILRYGFVSLTVLVISSVGLIFWLHSEIQDIEGQTSEAIAKYETFIQNQQQAHALKLKEQENLFQGTLSEQQILYEILRQEQNKVDYLDTALERIENLIGVEGESTDNNTLQQRVQIAEQTATEKVLMLNAIPNGYPLKDNQRITSHYGLRHHPQTHKKQRHTGIDFRAKIGTPVYATADGVVEFAGTVSRGYGKLVMLNHATGFKTVYAHLSSYLVRNGAVVKKGQAIAKSGNSGISTGPHLHYEVIYVQKHLDPKYFVKWSLTNYDQIFNQVRYVPWSSLVELSAFRRDIAEPSSTVQKSIASEKKDS